MTPDHPPHDRKPGSRILLALLGGGAILLGFLLWRGAPRGSGSAGQGRGSIGAPDDDVPPSPARLAIWLRAGDDIRLDTVDGVPVDLAEVIERAGEVDRVDVFRTGDTRSGWTTEVIACLLRVNRNVAVHPVPLPLGASA